MFTSFAVASCILSLVGCPGANAAAASKDLFPECGEWAERGDCKPSGRPYFMQKNCPESCHKKTHRDPDYKKVSDDQSDEFWELTAKAANGKAIAMENFEGYVTVLVNAARVCEYSDVFYKTLEHLHSVNPFALEILAFPFEHPDIDISSCKDELEKSEKKGGHKIHIMEPIEINGPKTHPVFKFLKDVFNMEEMDPNFSHYFFINPDGNIFELHYGASYKTLKEFVDLHVSINLGDAGKGNPGMNVNPGMNDPNMMDPQMMEAMGMMDGVGGIDPNMVLS